MARKGIIHPNKAARHKQRLNKALKTASLGKPAAASKGTQAAAKPAAKRTTKAK
jgi:hypothetical protein